MKRSHHRWKQEVTTEFVGIKELKAHLSRYLGEVRKGRVLLITDRGEAVAELHPLSPERQAVKSLADQGKVRWGGGKPRGLTGCMVEGADVASLLLEDRR
ncbi:MAG: type II toxin-antitoxin system prevent-host-death family antitoxin [Deltaproteobacteria bacterium]|nr:type II toxin-antitoxin system prevent-host-death family antitoxin [Deltaproteobacteria bacterium]